jgi:CO dehydrogenase/acetyl-CoA synthase gamma subunit (corrinoid Fe-S protein)
MKDKFLIGSIQVSGTDIPLIATELNSSDFWGAVMVRWGINRNNYRVSPGLYAIGSPDKESDVFVSANYKLSFDALRKNLSGENGWILVLDTKGVNVWCAAGKGTFGTKELVNRIRLVSLEKVVNHKRLSCHSLGQQELLLIRLKRRQDLMFIMVRFVHQI